MSRKRFLIGIVIFVLLCAFSVPSANADAAMWTQTYGGISTDRGYSVVATSDGGYAVAGYTPSFGAGSDDFWLIKTDANGGVQWNQTYGGPNWDYGWSVVETSDGGYAIAGSTASFGAGTWDVWLVKTDSAGVAQWNQTYGGTNGDWGQCVIETSDGGYAVAGYTASFGAGNADFYLVKTNAAGVAQWNQTYGGLSNDNGFSVVETSDGGYAIAGSTGSFGAGGIDFWLIKTDSAGVAQWNQTYGGADDEDGQFVVETIDGGYAMVGYTYSFGAGGWDVWLVKTYANGSMQWNQTYGGSNWDYGDSVIETSDGGYAIAGSTGSFGAGGIDFWLIKTDSAGVAQWNQTYGGVSADRGFSVVETSDGGYAVAGFTASFGAGSEDAWLIKTDEFGVVPETLTLGVMLLSTIAVIVSIRCCRKRPTGQKW